MVKNMNPITPWKIIAFPSGRLPVYGDREYPVIRAADVMSVAGLPGKVYKRIKNVPPGQRRKAAVITGNGCVTSWIMPLSGVEAFLNAFHSPRANSFLEKLAACFPDECRENIESVLEELRRTREELKRVKSVSAKKQQLIDQLLTVMQTTNGVTI